MANRTKIFARVDAPWHKGIQPRSGSWPDLGDTIGADVMPSRHCAPARLRHGRRSGRVLIADTRGGQLLVAASTR